jgi:hypothetical protein
MHTMRRQWLGISGLVLIGVWLLSLGSAAAQPFYVTDEGVRAGMLASVTKNPQTVAPASNQNASSLVGVIGSGTQATDYNLAPSQMNVETEGVVTTLVSTLSGDVAVGDRISPSILVGFGAKNTASGWIVGVAQASLDAQTAGAVRSTITDTMGGQHQVYVASIPVLVKVAYYNAPQPTPKHKKTVVPDVVQTAADSLAGHKVSQNAILLGSLLLFVGLIVSGVITNSAIRHGLRAVARQPLARHEIMLHVLQSLAIALVILAATFVAGLLVIRL